VLYSDVSEPRKERENGDGDEGEEAIQQVSDADIDALKLVLAMREWCRREDFRDLLPRLFIGEDAEFAGLNRRLAPEEAAHTAAAAGAVSGDRAARS
jgi:hypothetical protein